MNNRVKVDAMSRLCYIKVEECYTCANIYKYVLIVIPSEIYKYEIMTQLVHAYKANNKFFLSYNMLSNSFFISV